MYTSYSINVHYYQQMLKIEKEKATKGSEEQKRN